MKSLLRLENILQSAAEGFLSSHPRSFMCLKPAQLLICVTCSCTQTHTHTKVIYVEMEWLGRQKARQEATNP